jgi:hypothetical protein
MSVAHAYAVEIKEAHLYELEDFQVDPQREPMYIKDSVQVHHGRDLQNSQQVTPYGITMVKAKEVWSQFNVKGEDVRVCGKFVRIQLSCGHILYVLKHS